MTTVRNNGVKTILFIFMTIAFLTIGNIIVDFSYADIVYLVFIFGFSLKYIFIRRNKEKLY